MKKSHLIFSQVTVNIYKDKRNLYFEHKVWVRIYTFFYFIRLKKEKLLSFSYFLHHSGQYHVYFDSTLWFSGMKCCPLALYDGHGYCNCVFCFVTEYIWYSEWEWLSSLCIYITKYTAASFWTKNIWGSQNSNPFFKQGNAHFYDVPLYCMSVETLVLCSESHTACFIVSL